MSSSFSNRMTSYFAALLVLALGVLFVLWYLGFPQLGLSGARKQSLEAALRVLETRADVQSRLIAIELKERAEDTAFVAENTKLIMATVAHHAGDLLQKQIEIIEKTHHKRFRQILIVDLASRRILASSHPEDQGKPVSELGLGERFDHRHGDRALESWNGRDGSRVLAITSPVVISADSQSPSALLIATLDLQAFLEQSFQSDLRTVADGDTTLLFDQDGELITSFPKVDHKQHFFTPNQPVLGGFEGTLEQTNRLGEKLIVVYRKVQLGPGQTWTMVNYSRKDVVLAKLTQQANILLVAGFLITLISLGLIYLASRRLTSSLQSLATTAQRLQAGQWNVRATADSKEPSEIRLLTSAFNDMIEAIQNSNKHLEETISQRTEELKHSEARHLTLFNTTASAVMVLDHETIIDCNPAAIAVFGAHDRADLIGRHPSQLSPVKQANGDDSRILASQKIQVAQEFGQVAFEWLHMRLHSNEVFDAEVLLNRVELDGKVLIQGTMRDISERKRVEAALQASEERHRTLVEWSPEGINVHRKGRLIYVNAAAMQMLGADKPEQLLGKSIADIIHPDYHHFLKSRVRSVGELGARDQSHDLKFLRLDGQVIDVTAQGTLIDFDGAPSVYVAWRDVTELKRSEESRRIAATAFESQEGMFVTDAQWNILRINQSFSQITGYQSSELVGKPPHFLDDDFRNDALFQDMNLSIVERGGWQGEVVDRRKGGGEFHAWINISSVKDEQGVITHFVGTFNDITLRKVAEDEIRNLAFYDPLTQLPNRRLLMDRLEQALASGNRHKRKGALLFIDLDNFKTLNDTLGHDHGDLLLQQVAERLTRCTREGDTVARLGGDEFVVMLEDLEENAFDAANQAEVVAIKILSELNQTYWLGVNEHHSSPSIGVTLFGEKVETLAEPLKRADLAMYQAKAAGRNTIRFFDPKMQILVSQRVALEEDLRDAMLNEQFELYYQAQLTDDGKLFGAEVLIRWNHPTRGMISPAEFIPLAEETGLISILGYWVLYTATNQLAKWRDQAEFKDLVIAVNVSPSQFHQKNFVEQVTDALELTQADPQHLKLELTEGFSIANMEDVIAKMNRLKAIGVGFSLDDFGTGYSSLSYLKRLPLDQLKIDQSFVRDILVDPNDAAISKMVIVLAESLGLAVIAEGVETPEQQAFLAQQGCHAYQGYLYSKPLPLAQFEQFARRLFHSHSS
ncbi:EAL domain-containing protein [Undibacterium cyanobacteriorum]|uniref:EAL domain-containing protein n=1 Tax=Undibacterium cyanobacteriorum TaxID=3073561 RepID=A0ABY9RL88_9BURK|nr:EAL domain-containing protein [Undibacterium sp. 20NA77.5]WMW81025.1 EAL domain-containing protein [Undibacterium sp. 20NA77.5]